MDIKKTGFLNRLFKVNKKRPVIDTGKFQKKDSVDLSPEAKLFFEINKYKEVIRKLPDIRQEKVEQIKQKLKDESYMSQEVYRSVSEKLSDFLDEI